MQEARGASISSPCLLVPRVPICGLHSVNQLPLLRACNPGQWCKVARWSKGSSSSPEGASSGGDTSRRILTRPFRWGCIFDCLASLESCISSACLMFLLLPWVTYWFSNKFPFCQVSQVGFYCLHPVIRVLVHCSCPWPWSPNVVNSLSTVSRDAFQSYFCIVLKISSSRFFLLFFDILSNSTKCILCSSMKWNYVPSEHSLSLHLFSHFPTPKIHFSFIFSFYSILISP